MKNSKKKIVIFGGSGFIGTYLAETLVKADYEVVVVSRAPEKQLEGYRQIQWDSHSLGTWTSCLEDAHAIVNLAGKSVDCIKTPENCDEILRSRVESTRIIGEALKTCKTRPCVWVQMSTAHIYGDPLSHLCSEESASGFGIAPFVGKSWEEAYEGSVLEGIRKVILRTSFVLGSSGGALDRLSFLARMGLGGQIGHGKQGLSWIHIEDMSRIIIRSIEEEQRQGVYIATAPNPVSNKVFMSELRKALKVPFGLPAAAWMVNIAAPLLLRTDPELALCGRYCYSKRLKEEGFKFAYSEIEPAMQEIYKK